MAPGRTSTKSAKARPTLNGKEVAFINRIPYAKFATVGKDGSPHVTPTWIMYEGGKLVITMQETTLKVRNLRRDPRVAVLIDDGPRYLLVKGRAVVAGHRETAKDREKLAVKALGEEAGRRWAAEEAPKTKAVSVEVSPENVFAFNL